MSLFFKFLFKVSWKSFSNILCSTYISPHCHPASSTVHQPFPFLDLLMVWPAWIAFDCLFCEFLILFFYLCLHISAYLFVCFCLFIWDRGPLHFLGWTWILIRNLSKNYLGCIDFSYILQEIKGINSDPATNSFKIKLFVIVSVWYICVFSTHVYTCKGHRTIESQ